MSLCRSWRTLAGTACAVRTLDGAKVAVAAIASDFASAFAGSGLLASSVQLHLNSFRLQLLHRILR